MNLHTLVYSGDHQKSIDSYGYPQWGHDTCAFYRSSEELVDLIVPYFIAGLGRNEMCVLVTADLYLLEKTSMALEAAVPGFESRVRTGQIDIVPATDWHATERPLDRNRAQSLWNEKRILATSLGFDGIRITGDVSHPGGRDHWNELVRSGHDAGQEDFHITALCSYALDSFDAGEILGIATGHDACLVRQGGRWESVVCKKGQRPADVPESAAGRLTEQRLLRSRERQEILSESARLLLTSEKPEAIVHTICERVMEHLECHAFFNFLLIDETEQMHLNAFAGIPEDIAAEIEYLPFGVAVCGCVARDSARIVAEDIPDTPDERTELISSLGIQAYCCHPLIYKGQTIGTLSFGTRSRTRFREGEVELMHAVSNLVATAMARKQQEEKLRRKDDQIRRAYTDVIAAVTGGKLVLMTGDEIRQAFGELVIEEVTVSSAAELATARKILSAALDLEYLTDHGLFKRAMLPFSEALTNAVKHGGGGSFQLRRLDGYAQLIIRDRGPGIDFANLPHATLSPGFSTCGTLGMGFMIMLNESARMLLSTRPGETFVVMEMSI